MAGNKCSSHGSSKKWRETNGRCHGNGWQHFEHIESENETSVNLPCSISQSNLYAGNGL